MPNKILVLGNANLDLIFKIPRFHSPGETIVAENLTTAFGGKGANQALMAKRLGGDVLFMTKVGNDPEGTSYRKYLVKNGLNPKLILKDKKFPTGMAVIELTPNGENRIIASRGANSTLSLKDLNRVKQYWREIKVFVTQLEIPLPTAEQGLKMAKTHGAITILNPSPPVSLPSHILSLIDFIVPNEVEAQLLTGMKWKKEKDIWTIAKRLLEMGPKNVVITLGQEGLCFKNRMEKFWMKSFRVKVIDTTAAGDAFLGAFAFGLAENKTIREALTLANGAGALATTKIGAQPSLPSKKELNLFLASK